MKVVRNDAGQHVVLTRNGEIVILDAKDRELEKYKVPYGANLLVDENEEVKPGTVLCQWDPHSIPILAEVGGKVRFEDIMEGETVRVEKDPGGHDRRIDHRAQGRPAPADRPRRRQRQDPRLPLPARQGPHRSRRRPAGLGRHAAGQTPREVAGTQDITGGLPRVTEIFEARKPKDRRSWPRSPAPSNCCGEKRRGKRTIIVRSETRHRTRAPRAARQALAGPRRRLRRGRRRPDRRPAGSARHPAHHAAKRPCSSTCPRNPERLPQPGREDQRQAHRDHRHPDAAQGEGRDDRRHRAAARQRDRQVPVPRGQRASWPSA